MSYANSKDQYLQNAVLSASPSRLLIMLFDRLLLDVQRAEHTITNGDAPSASAHLLHAQEIVTELTSSLRVDVWDGARQVQALYLFLYSALVTANVSKDLTEVVECRELVEELRSTWVQAAALGAERAGGASGSTPGPASTPAGGQTELGELGVG